jgi:hypothetical protein
MVFLLFRQGIALCLLVFLWLARRWLGCRFVVEYSIIVLFMFFGYLLALAGSAMFYIFLERSWTKALHVLPLLQALWLSLLAISMFDTFLVINLWALFFFVFSFAGTCLGDWCLPLVIFSSLWGGVCLVLRGPWPLLDWVTKGGPVGFPKTLRLALVFNFSWVVLFFALWWEGPSAPA